MYDCLHAQDRSLPDVRRPCDRRQQGEAAVVGLVDSAKLTAASVVTTLLQAGDGSVDFFVFGDPV